LLIEPTEEEKRTQSSSTEEPIAAPSSNKSEKSIIRNPARLRLRRGSQARDFYNENEALYKYSNPNISVPQSVYEKTIARTISRSFTGPEPSSNNIIHHQDTRSSSSSNIPGYKDKDGYCEKILTLLKDFTNINLNSSEQNFENLYALYDRLSVGIRNFAQLLKYDYLVLKDGPNSDKYQFATLLHSTFISLLNVLVGNVDDVIPDPRIRSQLKIYVSKLHQNAIDLLKTILSLIQSPQDNATSFKETLQDTKSILVDVLKLLKQPK